MRQLEYNLTPQMVGKMFAKPSQGECAAAWARAMPRLGVSMAEVVVGALKSLHRPGIEPGPPAWQASILPLNQRCWSTLLQCSSAAVVAEWLRRLTRNQFPSGSVGSNPTNRVKDFFG